MESFSLPLPHNEEDTDRAIDIFERLLENSRTGWHHLVINLELEDGPLLGRLEFKQNTETLYISAAETMGFCHLLALGVSGIRGGMVMRTKSADAESVRGWKLVDGDPLPLNRAEVFTAYCYNPHTGEITAPESGVQYEDAPVIHF
ncbi:hypothetical protein ABZ638_31180 [Streptomyces sp. NPDC007107]|uniref:hypothetical protein n=1 Tax=Streptomyces sp. NPDC007107 TaxID=3156915 RepID=UPI0033D75937